MSIYIYRQIEIYLNNIYIYMYFPKTRNVRWKKEAANCLVVWA